MFTSNLRLYKQLHLKKLSQKCFRYSKTVYPLKTNYLTRKTKQKVKELSDHIFSLILLLTRDSNSVNLDL